MNSYQKYNENMDLRELDLKSLFVEVLKKWRIVLIICAITALLAALFGFVRSRGDNHEAVTPGELSAKEKQEVQEILDLEKQQGLALDFQQNSAYMSMDPFNRNSIIIQYLISTEQSGAQAIYETTKGFIENGGLAQLVAEGEDLPFADIANSIWEKSPSLSLLDNTKTTVGVMIAYYDEEICERLADKVEVEMDKYAKSNPLRGYTFTLDKIQRDNKTEADIGLLNNQRLVFTDIDARKAKIERLKLELNGAQKQALENVEKIEASSSLSEALKYLLAGLFVGCLISVLAVDMNYILNGKLKSKEEMKRIYGVKVFGVLCEEKKRKFAAIDRCIEKIEGADKRLLPLEQSMDVIDAELLLMCKAKGIKTIYLAVATASEMGNKYLEKMQNRQGKEGLELVIGNGIINNPEAMKSANRIGNIVLVEAIGKSMYEGISNELQLCSELNINVCGAILMDLR